MEKTMEKITALAKSRGFVYPGSEIYGGLANTAILAWSSRTMSNVHGGRNLYSRVPTMWVWTAPFS